MILVCWKDLSCSISMRRARGSRLELGSSMTRIEGCIASTVAMATARFSPPESRYGGRSRRCGAPTCASAASTRASTSSGGSPRLSGPKATSSPAVGMKSWSSGFWKIMPTVRRTSSSVAFVMG